MTKSIIELASIPTPFGMAKIKVDRYERQPRAPFVGLYLTLDGSPIGVLSVNPPQDTLLQPGEVCIKTWSENEPLVAPMLESGFFKDTGKRVNMGYVVSQIWLASQDLTQLFPD